MFQRAGLDFEALKVQARSRAFRPVVLTGASFSTMFNVATTTVETDNFLARLPGTTRPDETVLYTGHWDHIGVGTPDANGDAIFNGAIDNASGIAGMIELARLWAAGPRPERSIVMIGFTAEESGLLGSEYYAANPIYPLEKTVGGFNMDSANVYGRTAGFRVVGFGQSDFDDRMATVVQAQGRVVEPDGNPASGGYFRSDHFPLAKRGVPMAYAASGGDFRDEPIAARTAARADYTSRRYHQADDEWSADWDYSGQIEDLNVYLAVGRDLANSRDWPQWKPGSEFAPARAVSDAVRQ
jgi:Zn-dependent M28 family amino/carboxypeptidase